LQLEQVSRRLKAQRKIGLTFTDRAKRLLEEKGYDPLYGARPLKRVIQTLVLDPLALAIVSGTIPETATVTVDAKKSAIEIKVK